MDHEIDQFTDDPLEFIRLDLSLHPSRAGGAVVATTNLTRRRQAAADVVQALVGSGYEGEATEIVGGWIGEWLGAYNGGKGAQGVRGGRGRIVLFIC